MAVVKDVISILRNPDKSKPEKFRILASKETVDFSAKSDLLQMTYGDAVVEEIRYDHDDSIWVIKIATVPVKA